MAHSSNYTEYKIVFWITQAVGILGMVLLCVWVFACRGGLGWSTKLQFNWHVLSLPFGMVYLCALELMIFRALRYGRKKQLKLLHAAFAVPIILLLIIGYWSILDLHIAYNKPNWYSLHSWMGNLTTIFYLLQVMIGSLSFLWPKADPEFCVKYMPYHIFFGLTTFVLGTGTTLLGLFETIKKVDGYSSFSGEGVMTNLCGMLFVVFTILVVYMQTHHDYRRVPLVVDR